MVNAFGPGRRGLIVAQEIDPEQGNVVLQIDAPLQQLWLSTMAYVEDTGFGNAINGTDNFTYDIWEREGKRYLSMEVEIGVINPNVIEEMVAIELIEGEDVVTMSIETKLISYYTDGVFAQSDPEAAALDTIGGFIGFIEDNPEKVTLGYGPEHPLEDIEPDSIPRDSPISNPEWATETLRNWMVESIERTRDTGNEHAFYVDNNYNVVGIIEGFAKKVELPSEEDDSELFFFHTHPSLDAPVVPSGNDMRHNHRFIREEGIDCIGFAHESTYFWDDDDAEYLNREDYADNPINFSPLLFMSRRQVTNQFDCEEHYREQMRFLDEKTGALEERLISQIGSVRDLMDDQIFDILKDRVMNKSERFEVVFKNESKFNATVLTKCKESNVVWDFQMRTLAL